MTDPSGRAKGPESDFTASGDRAPVAGAAGSVGFQRGVPSAIDAFEFARRGLVQAGAFGVQRLSRLLDGLPQQPLAELPSGPGMPSNPGVVVYRVAGNAEPDGKSYLSLLVQARLVLDCQRCLGPMVWPVDHEAKFELVRSDADLDADDAELDEEDLDQPEKIVGSRRLDLVGMIEDELILDVPYIPRHEQCPGTGQQVVASADDASQPERPSPFAVLGQLKSKQK